MPWLGPANQTNIREYIWQILNDAGVFPTQITDSRSNPVDPKDYPYANVYMGGYDGGPRVNLSRRNEDRNTTVGIEVGVKADTDKLAMNLLESYLDAFLNVLINDSSFYQRNGVKFIDSKVMINQERTAELTAGGTLLYTVQYIWEPTAATGDDFDSAVTQFRPIEPNHQDAAMQWTIDKTITTDPNDCP